MKNAIILHGTLGSPNGNWFTWLNHELERRGFTVWLPQLPGADRPGLARWSGFVTDTCPFPIDEQTLIIGHSSGAILALIVAGQNARPIGGVVAVSVFYDNSLGWEPNNNLFDTPFDWPNIRKHTQKLLFVHSDNDPYVPLPQAQFVANNCQAELMVLPGEGHFNLEQSPDYSAFPKLLELLEQKHFI